MSRLIAGAFVAASLLLLAGPAATAERIKCKMRYDLEGWSIIYKQAKGTGRITCSNGQSADVRISTYGGGATLGTHKVIDGVGTFSAVSDISDLYGSYAEADVHAGAGGAANARAMMKGNVNLSLSGTGEGISLGLAFGAFNIEPQ